MQFRPAPTVLVVEDEPLVRLNASEMIREAGWNALEANDAGEALDVLAAHPEVDVLFTDITLPGDMDGLALAERVHKSAPQVELVVTSGKLTLPDKVLPDEGTFLRKPYRFDDLVEVISKKVSDEL